MQRAGFGHSAAKQAADDRLERLFLHARNANSSLMALRVTYVPVYFAPKFAHRLMKSVPEYLAQSTLTLFRAYAMYKPMESS
jgi:hypothetical protein